ncbi:hypothetical protein FB451DRAFT_1220540, partial [Mycena latifolia]
MSIVLVYLFKYSFSPLSLFCVRGYGISVKQSGIDVSFIVVNKVCGLGLPDVWMASISASRSRRSDPNARSSAGSSDCMSWRCWPRLSGLVRPDQLCANFLMPIFGVAHRLVPQRRRSFAHLLPKFQIGALLRLSVRVCTLSRRGRRESLGRAHTFLADKYPARDVTTSASSLSLSRTALTIRWYPAASISLNCWAPLLQRLGSRRGRGCGCVGCDGRQLIVIRVRASYKRRRGQRPGLGCRRGERVLRVLAFGGGGERDLASLAAGGGGGEAVKAV